MPLPRGQTLMQTRFERISAYLMTVFLDLLQELRGDFIRKMNDLLASHFDDYLEGRRPLRKFRFEQLSLETL
jgi:hypothetical protein